jgi:hypothetical protein
MDSMRGFRSMFKGYRGRRKERYSLIRQGGDDDVARFFVCSLVVNEYRVVDSGRQLEWLDVATINESWGIRPRLEPEFRTQLLAKKANVKLVKTTRNTVKLTFT